MQAAKALLRLHIWLVMELGWLFRTAVSVGAWGQGKTGLGILGAVKGFRYPDWETGGQRSQEA